MSAVPLPGTCGGFYRTSVWCIIDRAKTEKEAEALIVRAAGQCASWEDAIELVGEMMVREWLPDGASVLDTLPDVARTQVVRTTIGRWRRRRQQKIVQDAVIAAIETICRENAALGVDVSRAMAIAQIARWTSPGEP